MKRWHRYVIGLCVGFGVGGALAWHATGNGFQQGDISNGVWSTSFDYGTQATDQLTRASVARRGLLALPKSETIYWAATRDSTGALLDGSCTYAMTGRSVDSRWWSVTLYDTEGFLVPNSANIWSFSGAALTDQDKAMGWKVTISPRRPASGHWLASAPGQRFELTLRMYNPGPDVRRNPSRASLPQLTRESCA